MSADAGLAPPHARRVFDPTAAGMVLLVVLVSLSHAAFRLAMNHEDHRARWQPLLDMTASRPFVGRILVPRILHFWQHHATVRLDTMFFTVEAVSTLALVLGTASALRAFIGARAATLAGLVLVWGLSVPYLLQHVWSYYYPYDTPSLAFTAWGLYAVLERRTLLLTVLVFFGALNRETALLLPLLAAAFALTSPSRVRALLATWPVFAAFAVARRGVRALVQDLPGHNAEPEVYGKPRFINNFDWMNGTLPDTVTTASGRFHAFEVILFFLGLPVAYLVFRRFIPLSLRLLRIPLAMLFAALLVVGNLYEPRVFGEIIVVLYVVVVVGGLAWATGQDTPAAGATPNRLAVWLDRIPWGSAVFVGWWVVGSLCTRSKPLAAYFARLLE